MADAPQQPRIGMSIASVFAGLLTTAVLSIGTDIALRAAGLLPAIAQPMSTSLFVLVASYRVIYTVLGAYITALLAPAKPMKHVWILGSIGSLLALLGAAGAWNKPELGPRWYPMSLVVTALPAVGLGGKLRSMRDL